MKNFLPTTMEKSPAITMDFSLTLRVSIDFNLFHLHHILLHVRFHWLTCNG